ncbi:MAG: S41 family peptidase [Maricaulaceae bacterium]
MKYILPVLGSIAAATLFALTTTESAARSVENGSHNSTFEQLELFADVLARVRSDYVVNVDDEDLIADALNGMLQSLDPHSSYVSPKDFLALQETTSGEYGGLGMEVTSEEGVVKVVSPFDDSPADKAGIKAGDYLTAIEGDSILGLSLNEAVKQMRGKAGEPITVTVVTEGEDPRDVTLVREVIKPHVVRAEIKDGIGYLRLSQFNERSEDSLLEGIKTLKTESGGRLPGIVLDLRNNPGGLLDQSVKVSSTFLNGGEVVSIRGRRINDTQRFNALPKEAVSDIPLIVLINGASASASEIVAGAVQDRGRGIVLGTTSFGKGSVQSIIPLKGGRDGALRLTTQRYYTPSGRSIQGTGIEPDIAVSNIPEDESDNPRLREADLLNSIENEEATEEVAEDEGETLDAVIDYRPADYPEDGDYQLDRAIQILKDGSYSKRLADAG